MRAPGARSTRTPARWLAAALALLLLPVLPLLPVAPPAGGSHGPGAAMVDLEYIFDVTDPDLRADGKVQVTWRATGFRGHVSAFCLQVDNHEYPIDATSFALQKRDGGLWEYRPTDVNPAQGKPACERGFRALVEDLDEVQATFVLGVERPAFTPCGCEFNSFLGPDWGVVKGESLAIPFSYAFFEPQPAFRASLRFRVPPDWSAEAPYPQLGSNRYLLPGDPPLPRGFFALGSFAPEPVVSDGVGKEFVYVRLAGELRDKDTLFTYLEKATPYYQSVYGNVTGNRILVISAGAPMFTGGLGSTDSLFVHQNSSRATVAHEYAHVWQRYQTIDRVGQSSIWINEGDADLHGALSRFVTETEPGYTLQVLRGELRGDHDRFSRDPAYQQPLAAANYGGPSEQVAYKKGLATLVFLDHELDRFTGGIAGLNHVLRELNVEYDQVISERPGERRMTNDDVLRVVNRVLQRAGSNVDMRNFFDLYVFGPDWPPYTDVKGEVPIVFDRLEVDPAVVEPDGRVTVRVLATNVRSGEESRDVELLIDEVPADVKRVTLPSLGSTTVTFTVPAGEAGPHTARVAYLREDYRVKTPPRVSVVGVEPEDQPQAGVAFPLAVALRNEGEADGAARVEVTLAGQTKAVTVEVPGEGSARARLTFLVRAEGPAQAEVVVQTGDAIATGSASLRVAPRDSDGDGVPDGQDAYPDDPRFAEQSVLNDLRREVPGPAPGLLLLALLGAALLAARRRA